MKYRFTTQTVLGAVLSLLILGCNMPLSADLRAVPEIAWEVVEEYPHDPQAFTQGLLFHDGKLFESTGQYGESRLREVELATGKVLREHKLADSYFAEGLALLNDRLYQLTWKEGELLIYDLATFEELDRKSYWTEGWGLATDGTQLIMTDGTDTLSFRNAETFKEVHQVKVTAGGKPLVDLNELEFIDGQIWANIWGGNELVRIDPQTGAVTAHIDLQELAKKHPEADVLNGIAWNPEKKHLYVTGKYWPKLYVLRLAEQGGPES